MKNYRNSSDKIDYVNASSAISAGDVVDLGSIIGIAINDIAATTGTGPIAISGVFTLAKETGVAHSVGDLVYWDGTECTKTPGVLTLAGTVVVAAESADDEEYVAINVGVPARTTSLSFAKIYCASHTVTSGEATATLVEIDTSFAATPTGWIVQVLRSGVNVLEDGVVTALSGGDIGKIRIANGGATLVLAENDVINLIAWKD